MQLGKLGAVCFREITQKPEIQSRIALAHRVLPEFRVLLPAQMAVQKIANEVVTEADRQNPGIYFCSGGDISTFIMATRIKTFLCFDRMPLFDNETSEYWLGTSLTSAFWARLDPQHWHNCSIQRLGEVGLLAFCEILALGGSGLRIYAADGNEKLFKIVFELNNEIYQVYFNQEWIEPGPRPSLMQGFPVGVVFLKAGYSGLPNVFYGAAYEFLNATVNEFSPGTLIISDLPLAGGTLDQIPFVYDQEFADVRFGYTLGRAFLYRVKR